MCICTNKKQLKVVLFTTVEHVEKNLWCRASVGVFGFYFSFLSFQITLASFIFQSNIIISFLDKNECELFSVCEHGSCFNTDGGYYCECDQGFQEIESRRGCIGKKLWIFHRTNQLEFILSPFWNIFCFIFGYFVFNVRRERMSRFIEILRCFRNMSKHSRFSCM